MFPLENKYAIFSSLCNVPVKIFHKRFIKIRSHGLRKCPPPSWYQETKSFFFFCLSKLQKAYLRRPTAASLSRDRDPVTHVNPQTLFQALLCRKFFFLLNKRINFERMCASPRRTEGFFSWFSWFFFHDPSFWRCHTGDGPPLFTQSQFSTTWERKLETLCFAGRETDMSLTRGNPDALSRPTTRLFPKKKTSQN